MGRAEARQAPAARCARGRSRGQGPDAAYAASSPGRRSSARSSASACSSWARFIVLYLMVDVPDGQRRRPSSRATSTSTATARSSPAPARSTARSSTLEQDPQGRPAHLRRRREQDLLQGLRRRLQGHRPRPAQHAVRQGQAGRLDDHPAVRQELLPEPGPDRHPQAQGAGHLAQGGPQEVQGRDPRGLHQHQLLRPRRLRHPGRRPGLLRRRRREARRVAQGAYLAALLQAPEPVRLGDRHRDRQEAGHEPLELRPRQHGRGGLARRGRARRA